VEDWNEEIQRAIGRVLHAIANPDEPREPHSGRVAQLRERFSLSTFETDVLVLCAGHAIVPEVAERLSGRPTFGIALARIPAAHIDATSPTRPLRRHRLITIAPQLALFDAPLSIDERVLNFLLAIATIDERLLPHASAFPAQLPQTTNVQRVLADRIARLTGLSEDEMRWHERRIYDELKASGEPLQNPLEETTSYEKLNALYEKYC
jgi:hypothetical protein